MAVLVFGLLAGCASQESASEPDSKCFGCNPPRWVITSPDSCGVGPVQYRGKRVEARKKAMRRGREAFVRKLKRELRGIAKDLAGAERRGNDVAEPNIDLGSGDFELEHTYISEGENPEYYGLVCPKWEAIERVVSGYEALNGPDQRSVLQDLKKEFEEVNRRFHLD